MKRLEMAFIAFAVIVIFVFSMIAIGLSSRSQVISNADRLAKIPSDSVKMTPGQDLFKPVIHSGLWADPIPMPGPVNTAGGEDSPFITPDGEWFFFFFTPDVDIPAQDQLTDGVTGIWWAKKDGGGWTSPEKIVLCGDVSLDGAEFVQGNEMWFASVRAGNYGEIDVYTADYRNGRWTNVENAGEQLNVDYDIGEFHITADGSTLYFHTGNNSGGLSSLDLYYCKKAGNGWGAPVACNINTDGMEGYPFISADGSELWFTGWSKLGFSGPALFRCQKIGNDLWGTPEEIVSNFAGECTMDSEGNMYFVHHYFDASMDMIEADIYVAYRQ